MKKYITLGLMVVMSVSFTTVSAAQPVSFNPEAKAALIKELTFKLNELVAALNALLAGQDMRIKTEVSNSRVNAEIYYVNNPEYSFKGVCTDITERISKSLLATKSSGIVKLQDTTCFDSNDNYALSIKNSKGYTCADSTGDMRETVGPVVGVTCPVK